MTKPRTLYDKIWDDHLVDEQPDGTCLLYIDRHLVHEVTSPQAFEGLRLTGRKVRAPDKTLCVVDHNVPTTDRNLPNPDPESARADRLSGRERQAVRARILRRVRQAPGHRPHHRPGAGLHPAGHDPRVRRQPHRDPRRVRRARLRHRHLRGRARARHPDADPDQVEEHARRGRRQAAAGRQRQGHHPGDHRRDRHRRRHRLRARICRRGDPRAVDGRPHDGLQHVDRGRRQGRASSRPDEKTYAYLKDRPKSPKGAAWDAAMRYWETLLLRRRARISTARSGSTRRSCRRSSPGAPVPSRWCRSPAACRCRPRSPTTTSGAPPSARSTTWASRAARRSPTSASTACSSAPAPTGASRICARSPRIVEGKHVNASVNAMIVPGSGLVKEQAEAEGLDQIFKAAGFEWREPGCSMCLAMNPDKLKPGERCASTSNRNFEGRQGYRAAPTWSRPPWRRRRRSPGISSTCGSGADPHGGPRTKKGPPRGGPFASGKRALYHQRRP